MEWYMRAVVAVVVAGLCVCVGTAGGAAAGGVRLWGCGRRLEYALESAALLNEAPRRDQGVGWRLAGALALTPLAFHPDTDEALLKFEFPELELGSRGAALTAEWVTRPSEWPRAARSSPFYAHWRAGTLLTAYLPTDDTPHIANYKRAVLSLFQFQILDGERNETDATGVCRTQYETLGPHDFRKIKSGCLWEGGGDGSEGVSSRRLTRYTLRPTLDALNTIYSEEVHVVEGGWGAEGGVKVRGWMRLTLRSEEKVRTGSACGAEGGAGLPLALVALPPAAQAALLPLQHTHEQTEYPIEEEQGERPLTVTEAVSLLAGLEGAGDEGGASEGDVEGEGWEDSAPQLLRVYAALRAASAAELTKALRNIDDSTLLVSAARAVGSAGSREALQAGVEALQLRAADPLQPAAAAFLAAMQVAPEPHPQAVKGLLSLSTESRCARVRAGALLAAAAAARWLPDSAADTAAAVRDHIAAQLARCKEAACRSLHMSALGNLRRADTGEALVTAAARGGTDAAGAALQALWAAPAEALRGARLQRLLDIATNTTYTFDVRAAALDLAVTRSAEMPGRVAGVARRLLGERGAPAHELRRVLWQRLHALAPRHVPVRDLLSAMHTDRELGNWHAQAHHGTSSVLWRETGWGVGGAGGVRAALDSAQFALGGVLRRGAVTLHAVDTANDTHPLLQVAVWTTGMQALMGGQGGDGEGEGEGQKEMEEEAVAAGLTLSVGGAALPPITLFESQSELLGAVWAGRGSQPTPVLRALLPLAPRAAAFPLVGLWAHTTTAAGGTVSLDAHAAVSLWSRTAAARLALRASLAHTALIHLHTPYAAARVRTRTNTAVTLNIAADCDFYNTVSVCVRAHTPPHTVKGEATLVGVAGARRGAVRRRRQYRTVRPGRTLALGAQNDRACRNINTNEL